MRRQLLLASILTSVAAPMPAAAFAFDARDDQVVCRRDREKVLGSNMRAARTCRTRAEWRQIEEHTQNEMQQFRDGQTPIEPPPSGVQALDRTINVPSVR